MTPPIASSTPTGKRSGAPSWGFCSVAELDQFIDGSKPLAVGWIGFYWGKTIPEYKQSERSIADALTLEWLEYFVRKTPDIVGSPANIRAP